MISKLFGEYTATILLLLAGIAVFSFGVSTNTGITLKIGATMLGAILTLVNGFKLIWLSFFDGKEDDTKFAIANPYTKKYEAVNVERWITPLTLIGLTLATGLMFMAFTFKEKPKEIIAWEDNPIPDFTEMEEPPPTDHPKPPPPIVTLPPPKIEIVKDDIVVKDEPVIEEIVIEIEEVIEIPNPEDVIGDIVEEIIIEEKIPEIVNEEPEIFEIVEEMPSFPGGDNELLKYLSKK